jgi:flagella basal body P-ring formation protein FlgA
VVDRGDIVNGWIKRGLLQINLKVEVMEEAAPGQLVRVKNIRTKKYMRGVVQDENSIVIP